MKLYFLAHAGSTAEVYRRFTPLLAPGIKLVPLDAPGRGQRFGQPLLTSLSAIRDDLMTKVDLSGEPFSFYGHSMGALVAFLMALKLEEVGAPLPRRLFMSGNAGPGSPRWLEGVERLEDEAFLELMREVGGCPEGFFDEPELVSMFLPVLRADLTAVALHNHDPKWKTSVPLTLFHGSDDQLSGQSPLAWQQACLEPVEHIILPGGHFFPFTEFKTIAEVMLKNLES